MPEQTPEQYVNYLLTFHTKIEAIKIVAEVLKRINKINEKERSFHLKALEILSGGKVYEE